MDNFSVFSYKPGNSFFHRLPSWIKILLIPAFNVALFILDWKIAAVFAVLHVILFFILRFSVREQIKDLKPVIYYAVFLYCMLFLMQVYGLYQNTDLQSKDVFKNAFFNTIYDMDTAFFCVKFLACVQSCSLMFKTSTSLEIRTGIENIETVIRKCIPFVSKEPEFSLAVSMLINFIPTVFKLWTQLKRAWIARGGKQSPKMALVLIPKLFTLGLNFAYNTTKALVNRGE